jgi:hypothetical protein
VFTPICSKRDIGASVISLKPKRSIETLTREAAPSWSNECSQSWLATPIFFIWIKSSWSGIYEGTPIQSRKYALATTRNKSRGPRVSSVPAVPGHFSQQISTIVTIAITTPRDLA